MDTKENNGVSYKRVVEFNKQPSKKYDYEKEGVLNKMIPKILFKGNPVLVTFLQLIDMRIILMLRYIKRLKNFKNISLY